ncbi:MAG: hypothetical protein HGA65_07690, partial [Oscillochloris sp.]|nr:hypothetical protein [Oscillochloris sp.]
MTRLRRDRTGGARLHLLAGAGYLALAIWLTWPTAAHLGEAYFTSGNNLFFFPATPDAPQNIWNFWWGMRALSDGQSPFFSPLLYYPQGVQMLMQTMNIVAIGLTLPVNGLLGPLAAYNTAAILGVALSGYFGFLLVRAFGGRTAGSLLAGALLTACPLHIAKFDSGQLNFVSMQWVILFMLAALALVRLPAHERGWHHDLVPPLLAALAFLLVLLTDWYWALVAAAFGGSWMLLALVGAPRPWQLLQRYLAFGLLAGAACLPMVMTLLADGIPDAGQPQGELWAAYSEGYSSDARGLFFPAALNPLWSLGAERFLMSVAPHGITEGSYTAAGW